MASRIYVAPLENPYADAIGLIVDRIRGELDASAEVIVPPIDVMSAFDATRRQYNSTSLIERLLDATEGTQGYVIGVTGVDLFIPVLTFVFGEAQLNGRAAVASSFRLRNSFYGLPDDHTLTLQRLAKECLHELGHTFGLIHCDDYRCVMHAASSVEEVDLKGDSYCAPCRHSIDRRRQATA